MKMQFLSVTLVLLTIFSQNASCTAIGHTDLESKLLEPSETSLVPLQRSVRAVDIFDLTRSIIQGVITNLENAVSTASQTLGNLNSLVDNQTVSFLTSLNITLVELSSGVEKAVQNALTSGQVVVISIIECTNQHQVIAEVLVRNTLNNVTQCVSSTVNSVTVLFSGATDLANAAVDAAANVSAQVTACGIADFTNFIQVGTCLNNVLANAQTRANTLVQQLNTLTTYAVGLVTSAPVNFALCATNRLSNAAIAAVKIIQDIGKCASDAVNSVQLP